jgi:hypothetical protein
MLPYARLKPGAGFRLFRAVAYYLQRTVTHPPARRVASAALAAYVRARQGTAPWRLGEEGRRASQALMDDGIAQLEPLLDPVALEGIRAYFASQRLVAPNGRVLQKDLPAEAAAAAYPLETVLACPGLVALMNRADILALAAAYLGCKPTISSVGVRWTFPGAGREARFQHYHRDLDDWRFVKLFVYLTDVDEGGGPHVYVRGSHRTRFSPMAEGYDEAGLLARYGPAAITPMLGPCGTSFIADTLGVHRAGNPQTAPRLILQIQYSLLPVFAFLYAPAATSESDYDPYCSRLLLRPSATAASPPPRRHARRPHGRARLLPEAAKPLPRA